LSRVVIYLRVSTDRQERKGSSLSAQERACRRYCESRGLDVVSVVRERVSGRKDTTDRPGLLGALEQLEEDQADGLVVWALDRFARNVHSATGMIAQYFGDGRGYSLHVTTEDIDTTSAGGRLMLHIRLSIAQYEAERSAERVKAVKAHLRELGCYAGGRVPYGYTIGPKIRVNPGGRAYRKLVPAPEEQKTIQAAAELRSRGLSLREVARMLENQGVRSRKGTTLHPMQVKRLLEQTKIAG
jgi:DNA invertase Pin-like site-specific DNA recombinase